MVVDKFKELNIGTTHFILSMTTVGWIALYTRARREKIVAQQLQQSGIESYVPLRRELHRWSDRQQWVEKPLIPSYVFARVEPRDHAKVFMADGIVRVVSFHGRVARVRDSEIELLRIATKFDKVVSVSANNYHLDDEVEIVAGVFAGYRGRVIWCNKLYSIGIRIEELEYILAVEVPKADVCLLVNA